MCKNHRICVYGTVATVIYRAHNIHVETSGLRVDQRSKGMWFSLVQFQKECPRLGISSCFSLLEVLRAGEEEIPYPLTYLIYRTSGGAEKTGI